MAKKLVAVFGLSLLVGSSAVVVQAEYSVVRFRARVTFFNDFYCQCLDSVEVGSELTGYYTFDTEMSDQDPSPRIGLYPDSLPPAGIVVNVGVHEWFSDPDNPEFSITLHDSTLDQWGLHDGYLVREGNSIDTLRYLIPSYIRMTLRDNSRTALTSDALPPDAPILSDWATKREITVMGPGAEFEIIAVIDSMWTEPPVSTRPTDWVTKPSLSLLPNFPNPFSSTTTIKFKIETSAKVTLEVFEVEGKRIFLDEISSLEGQINEYIFRGKDQYGHNLPTGMYFYRINTDNTSASSKLSIIR